MDLGRDHREVDSNNYEQVSDPAHGSGHRTHREQEFVSQRLRPRVPGAHGFDAPAGWRL
jgi:hypothetical protein